MFLIRDFQRSSSYSDFRMEFLFTSVTIIVIAGDDVCKDVIPHCDRRKKIIKNDGKDWATECEKPFNTRDCKKSCDKCKYLP